MKKHGSRMTASELKSLYPDIKLMEGYDAAFVGVVPAPQSGCIAVYDSTKIIDILSMSGFTTQKDLVAHFEKVVASAQVKDGNGRIGPLFMQSVVIREENTHLTEADLEEHRARIERHRKEEEDEGDWHIDYGLEGKRVRKANLEKTLTAIAIVNIMTSAILPLKRLMTMMTMMNMTTRMKTVTWQTLAMIQSRMPLIWRSL